MKIDFRKFPMYQGISKQVKIAVDVAESLANTLYINVPGIKAHVLAEKIYKAEGEEEYSIDEVDFILSARHLFSGNFVDSLADLVKER